MLEPTDEMIEDGCRAFYNAGMLTDWEYLVATDPQVAGRYRNYMRAALRAALAAAPIGAEQAEALDILDALNEEGNIEYGDYSTLHDLISAIPTFGVKGSAKLPGNSAEAEHFHIWSELPCKPGRCRMEATAPAEAGEREALAHILDTQGAQTGECGHEPGDMDECDNGCRELMYEYADAILRAGFRRTTPTGGRAPIPGSAPAQSVAPPAMPKVGPRGTTPTPEVKLEYGHKCDESRAAFGDGHCNPWPASDECTNATTYYRRRTTGPWEPVPTPENGEQ